VVGPDGGVFRREAGFAEAAGAPVLELLEDEVGVGRVAPRAAIDDGVGVLGADVQREELPGAVRAMVADGGLDDAPGFRRERDRWMVQEDALGALARPVGREVRGARAVVVASTEPRGSPWRRVP